jgi:hypothetical protein
VGGSASEQGKTLPTPHERIAIPIEVDVGTHQNPQKQISIRVEVDIRQRDAVIRRSDASQVKFVRLADLSIGSRGRKQPPVDRVAKGDGPNGPVSCNGKVVRIGKSSNRGGLAQSEGLLLTSWM